LKSPDSGQGFFFGGRIARECSRLITAAAGPTPESWPASAAAARHPARTPSSSAGSNRGSMVAALGARLWITRVLDLQGETVLVARRDRASASPRGSCARSLRSRPGSDGTDRSTASSAPRRCAGCRPR